MKKELREKVWKKYNCKCAYCGEDLEYKKMQVDHIEAKYLGGKDDIKNYNPSCRQCNFYKSSLTIDRFKEQLATITERIKKPFIVRLAMKYGIISFKPFDGKFYYEKLNEHVKNGNDFIANVSKSYLEKFKLDIKLNVDGILPKYIKVYTEKELVTISSDKKTFIEADIKYTRLFDFIYKHISGNDIEHWMLFELKDVSDFSKYVC